MSDAFGITAPEIRTQRLTLRRLALTDAPAVHAYASDPEVAHYTLWPPHPNAEFTRGFLTHLTAPSILGWAILLRDSPEAIGMVFFHSLNRQHRKAEIAFNLGRRYWKQGLATEATTAALEIAFDTLGLNRVEATCMPANVASRRVLEKIGMVPEGIMRRSHHRYDGYHDMILFSILRDDRAG